MHISSEQLHLLCMHELTAICIYICIHTYVLSDISWCCCNSRLISFHFVVEENQILPKWLSFNYNKAECQMHLQLRPSVCGSPMCACVRLLCPCVCVLACKCNYNGPGHICVAYFEAYFLAGKRQLQQQPLSLPLPLSFSLPVCAHGIKLQMMLCPG